MMVSLKNRYGKESILEMLGGIEREGLPEGLYVSLIIQKCHNFSLVNGSKTIYLDICSISQACTKGGIFIKLLPSSLAQEKKKH